MASISAETIKELRGKTGAGIMDCKEALTECGGDLEKALDFLRKKGMAIALKRSGRGTSEGTIQSYIHMNSKIGVLVEVNCETDFVARNVDFVEFARNVAMHVAAMNPVALSPEEVPAEIVERERNVYREQVIEEGKPENLADKIVDGKMNKFFKESCLLSQAYVKNSDVTIQDLLNEIIAKIGENIRISRFVRYQIGE